MNMYQLKNLLLSTFFLSFLLTNACAQQADEKSIISNDAKLEKLGDGYAFTEGPAIDKDGNVYFTDQPNNKIYKWSTDGEITLFTDESGRSNGMFFNKEGKLVTCADMDNQIWVFDMDGNHEVILEDYGDNLLNGPNDLWIDPKGGIYFTDPLYKRNYWTRDTVMQQDGQHVYYISPDKKEITRVDENLVKPNGIIGTPDGKKLYVADIWDKKTYVYDIKSDGSLSNRKLFTTMGSDGMTIDNKGNIYLTGDGVTVFDKNGKQIAHIPIEKTWTANVCFGGTDRDMLFITATKVVYGLKMNVKGVY
ncbi:MAG: SMP-30/gluconolactonase/LRE family protein [Cyclobacteriaceae bacterium]